MIEADAEIVLEFILIIVSENIIVNEFILMIETDVMFVF